MTQSPTRDLLVMGVGTGQQLSVFAGLRDRLSVHDDGRDTLIERRPEITPEPRAFNLHYACAGLKDLVSVDLRIDDDLPTPEGIETIIMASRCFAKTHHIGNVVKSRDDPNNVVHPKLAEMRERSEMICAHLIANRIIEPDAYHEINFMMPGPAWPAHITTIANASGTLPVVRKYDLQEVDDLWGGLPRCRGCRS